jgi:hypothetical protein
MTPIDYAAEYRRIRIAHGLDPEVPQHVRDAVSDLLTLCDADGNNDRCEEPNLHGAA